MDKLAEKYLVFHCVSGSHAYGLNRPDSDFDTRGIFIAPPEYSFGVFKRIEQFEDSEKDETIFEFDKFVKLAVECNPSILEYLFTDEENIRFIDWPFQELRNNRDLFLSKKAKFTYSGYAFQQISKMKNHYKWHSKPYPEEPPKLNEFCKRVNLNRCVWTLSDKDLDFLSSKHFVVKAYGQNYFIYDVNMCSTISDEIRILPKKYVKPGIVSEDGQNIVFYDEFPYDFPEYDQARCFRGILMVNLEGFQNEVKKWSQYWEWKKNRNEKRAIIENKVGYDAKNAVHLIRLYTMGEEILTQGKVIVKRPDAPFLRSIMEGAMTYDEILKFAEEKEKKLDELYETSTLRKYADIEKINNLVIDIKKRYWKEKGLL